MRSFAMDLPPGRSWVCLVLNGRELPHAEELVGELAKIPGMTSITLSPNMRQTNVIMGDSFEVLWGSGYITDYIGRRQIPDLPAVVLSG